MFEWKTKSNKMNSVAGFKLRLFNERGVKPFINLNFDNCSVYKTSRFDLSNINEYEEIVNKLSRINGNFEYWVIPSVFNPSESVELYANKLQAKGFEEEKKKLISEMFDSLPSELQAMNEYVIVAKQDEQIVIKELGAYGFRLEMIEPAEALGITVTYKTSFIQ